MLAVSFNHRKIIDIFYCFKNVQVTINRGIKVFFILFLTVRVDW